MCVCGCVLTLVDDIIISTYIHHYLPFAARSSGITSPLSDNISFSDSNIHPASHTRIPSSNKLLLQSVPQKQQ